MPGDSEAHLQLQPPVRAMSDSAPVNSRLNWPLLPIRLALFFFFGGLSCLVLFLPLHMREVGLSEAHARIISTVAPLVSVLGPLVVGPASDRLGKHKQVLLTGSLLLGAACYCLLLAVPLTSENGHFHESLLGKAPSVQLRCGPRGATIVQERCAALCPHWSDAKSWEVTIKKCFFDCADTPPAEKTTTPAASKEPEPEVDLDVDYADESKLRPERSVDGVEQVAQDAINPDLLQDLPPEPKLCFTNAQSGGGNLCNQMSGPSELRVNLSLPEVVSKDATCHYPLGQVRVYATNETYGALHCKNDCLVKCSVGGALWDRTGESHLVCPSAVALTAPEVTFWSYMVARSIAEMFPAASLALADALLVAQASSHEGDVGRELAWGAAGAGVAAPLVALLVHLEATPWPETPSALPILAFALLSILAALSLIPLRPPSVWYSRRLQLEPHPHPSRLAHPAEASVLLFVLLLLGIFWASLDTYLPWFLWDAGYEPWQLGLTVTAGVVLALPLLWNSESLVEYCGFTNIFIVAFAFYIIRFTGYGFLEATWPALVSEIFEVFTLVLMWAAAVIYTRNLAAKHLTATSQAFIVVAHFCLGRFLGALISSSVLSQTEAPWDFFKGCSVAAAFAGWIYFCIYYCCVRPGCGRKRLAASQLPPEGAVTNGSYTPLRIYRGDDQQQQRRF